MDIRKFCIEKLSNKEDGYYIDNDKEYFFLVGKWYRFMGRITKEKVNWNVFAKNVSLKNCTNEFIHEQIQKLWMNYNRNQKIAEVDKITAAILGYTPDSLDDKMDILHGYIDDTVNITKK